MPGSGLRDLRPSLGDAGGIGEVSESCECNTLSRSVGVVPTLGMESLEV